MSEKVLTGRKVFAITASAFALIIGVNFLLAYKAVSTFPGLEVRNSYVASQTFDADRAAQTALGWQLDAAIAGSDLTLSIRDPQGKPVQPATLAATLGRPTEVRDDQVPDFAYDGSVYVASILPAPGNWYLWVEATAADGTLFKQRLAIWVK